MTYLLLKQLLALGLTMVLWMGVGSSAANAGIPVGSMLLSSCSYIPDYSTQEYRPPDASDSDTAGDEQQAPEDGDSAEDPSGAAAADSEEAETQLNFLQRFWQGLFGG